MHLRPIMVAQVAYEADRLLEALLENSRWLPREPWVETDLPTQESVIVAIMLYLDGNPPSAQAAHTQWLAGMHQAGWVFGPVRDTKSKQHPLMRPWVELDHDSQLKARLFHGIVSALMRED